MGGRDLCGSKQCLGAVKCGMTETGRTLWGAGDWNVGGGLWRARLKTLRLGIRDPQAVLEAAGAAPGSVWRARATESEELQV